MKRIGLAFALALLTALCVAPAVMAQEDCPRGPGVTYISHDPEECLTLQFICADGEVRFDSECGCGCMETSSAASVMAPAELTGAVEVPSHSEAVQTAGECEVPERPTPTLLR